MVHPFGCHTYYKPNALADEWLSKIKLVETAYNGGRLAYRIEGLPCWTYDFSEHTNHDEWPSALMNQYNNKGCWYGICLAHSVVHTAILQERTKGGWTNIDGVQLKAMGLRVTAPNFAYHGSIEIYIKDKGYFMLDVGPDPRMIIPPGAVWWNKRAYPTHMGNRHFCDTTGDYSKEYYLPYNSEWAGPRITPPSKINCVSSPSGASIWFKKY